ncbi:hypothetical protein [Streptomyces sp. NBC_00572]|uniref:hypothetical protein n=1 Tax=Streptomyces sp. NBC_00572 TaxID=2903664 RepID=UPI0022500FDF|nr:hypothetical protein [Streptomyces sp. NBC_00572]MCX4983585.1 hypothetical protein [Streptomyces sp. NBC_00572]
MTTLDTYESRCERLFLAGGNAAVRRAAQEGLDALGPQADLYCWLALGHAAEDEDDHDDLAEEAFRAGLALDGDHLGLLAGYAELCLRADGFDHPGRANRAVVLSRRLKELAPESAEADRLASAERWARRGYWDDLRMGAVQGKLRAQQTQEQARALSDALAEGGADAARAAARAAESDGPADRDTAVRAATVEALAGPWNAPVRFLGRYRPAAWAVSAGLALLTNQLLRQTGAVESFSVWGYLWLLPVLLVDRRFASVRKEAEARHVARLETELAARD